MFVWILKLIQYDSCCFFTPINPELEMEDEFEERKDEYSGNQASSTGSDQCTARLRITTTAGKLRIRPTAHTNTEEQSY